MLHGPARQERRAGPCGVTSCDCSARSAEQLYDFSRQRVALQLRLLEHGDAVLRHLEAAARARLEFDVCPRKVLGDLGRQTDGPRLVASKRAVFDQVLHLSRWGGEKYSVPRCPQWLLPELLAQ